jgi:LmbE family N-acetylglucosaminyl deacetylase
LKNIVFIFAHQDDEFVAFSHIEKISGQSRIVCLYLTNGNGNGVDPKLRDQESRNVLLSLGVEEEDIHFLGSEFSIQDGKLCFELDKAYSLIQSRLLIYDDFEKIFSLSWEGGHPDHDSVHLLALAYAIDKSKMLNTFQMPLYNGYKTFWKFFRISICLRENGKVESIETSLKTRISQLLSIRFYKSQWKTWMALLPGFILHFLFNGKDFLQPVHIDRTKETPHQGKLLYERMFGISFVEFMKATENFRNRNLYE